MPNGGKGYRYAAVRAQNAQKNAGFRLHQWHDGLIVQAKYRQRIRAQVQTGVVGVRFETVSMFR